MDSGFVISGSTGDYELDLLKREHDPYFARVRDLGSRRIKVRKASSIWFVHCEYMAVGRERLRQTVSEGRFAVVAALVVVLRIRVHPSRAELAVTAVTQHVHPCHTAPT